MKFLLIALLFVSQSAFAEECFWSYKVRNFEAVDNNTVIIDAGINDYELEVNFCWDLEWAHKIAFRTFSGSQRVCKWDKLLVIDNFSNHIKQECTIRSITKLSKKTNN